MDDLAIVLVSHYGAPWLRPCLTSIDAHRGDCALDVVVVANSDDETEQIVTDEFPHVRFLRCENHGFAHANNIGIRTCDARYVLLLNVDTEILQGTFDGLVAVLDSRPNLGAAGVRQVSAEGELAPTIRRFPSALRALGETIGVERLPWHPARLGERELDPARYDEPVECDWSSGSFLVLRREALDAVGLMDERFFLYSEETDLCFRIKAAGWRMLHLPDLTILHHADKAGFNARLSAQSAYAKLQFARKHLSAVDRLLYRAALVVGFGLRAWLPGLGGGPRRTAARAALRVSLGVDPPPFLDLTCAGTEAA